MPRGFRDRACRTFAAVFVLGGGCIDSYPPGPSLVWSDGLGTPCDDAGSGELSWDCPKFRTCDQRLDRTGIRIVDWNIKAATSQGGLDAIVQTLRELDPDVVLLQEVDSMVGRSGDIDEPRALAESLGPNYQYVYAPTLTIDSGRYGIATLSRLAFLSVSQLSLSNKGVGELRTAIDAILCAGPQPYRIVNHHADYEKSGAATSSQEILSTYHPSVLLASVFSGDFNQTPSEAGPAAFVGAGLRDMLAAYDDRFTFGSSRIDYFFVSPRLAEQVIDARVIPTDASDHSLIVLDL